MRIKLLLSQTKRSPLYPRRGSSWVVSIEHPWMLSSICGQPTIFFANKHRLRFFGAVVTPVALFGAGHRAIHKCDLQTMACALRKLLRKMIRPPASVDWVRPWHEIYIFGTNKLNNKKAAWLGDLVPIWPPLSGNSATSCTCQNYCFFPVLVQTIGQNVTAQGETGCDLQTI